jgi:hypothetical protein
VEVHNWLLVGVFALQASAAGYSFLTGAPKVGIVMLLVGCSNLVMATIKA